MNSLRPLPREMLGRPFSVSESRSRGISPERLRRADLVAPFRGVRAPASEWEATPSEVESARHRCAAFAPRLRPGEMFYGTSAAVLWSAPLPPGAASGTVVVAAPTPLNAARARGASGHQISDPRIRATRLKGLVVADAASTWLSLATELSLNDLIAVGDFLAHRPVYPKPGDRRPFVTLDELASRVDDFHGRGKRRASEALAHVCTGAESRPETLLRMVIHDAGLPPPMVNPEVLDSRGDVIGRADLVYPQWRLIVEYDGDQHRTDDRQYDRDMARHERFHLAGYAHLRVRKHALFATPDLTTARIEIALRRSAWTP